MCGINTFFIFLEFKHFDVEKLESSLYQWVGEATRWVKY